MAAFEFFAEVRPGWCRTTSRPGGKPDLYAPKINRSYAERAAHYGFLIDPARALKPRDKTAAIAFCAPCARRLPATSARLVPHLRQRRDLLPRQNEYRACRWEGAAPAVVFEAVEKDALKPLPSGPFTLATWATAKIGPDICSKAVMVLCSCTRYRGSTSATPLM